MMMKRTRSGSLVSISVLSLLFGALSALASPPQIQPAKDLGEDVMKPMAKLFRAVGTEISDGAQNPSTLKALSDLSDKIDVAVVTTPDTDAYKSEVALVGADAALTKYQSLLKVLKVEVEELSATVRASGTKTCGDPCNSILDEMKQLESIGHSTFKDSD